MEPIPACIGWKAGSMLPVHRRANTKRQTHSFTLTFLDRRSPKRRIEDLKCNYVTCFFRVNPKSDSSDTIQCRVSKTTGSTGKCNTACTVQERALIWVQFQASQVLSLLFSPKQRERCAGEWASNEKDDSPSLKWDVLYVDDRKYVDRYHESPRLSHVIWGEPAYVTHTSIVFDTMFTHMKREKVVRYVR